MTQSLATFLTVTPSCWTVCGRRGCAMSTRLCVNTSAVLRSVPSLKFSVSVSFPSPVDWLEKYCRFSMPLICCSSGDSLAALYLDFGFPPEDPHVLIDTPEQVFAEYMAHPTVRATGRTVHHLLTGRLVAENGQIKLLRESLNPV